MVKNIGNEKKIQHLYLRAGFGISISDFNEIRDRDAADIAGDMLKGSSADVPAGKYDAKRFDLKIEHGLNLGDMRIRDLSKEERQELRRMSRRNIIKLNTEWVKRMVTSDGQLREKMTFFWHNHFACRSRNSIFTENQNNTLRKYSLGKFKDLLLAISKDPAMLQFLNNQQNRKQSSNENFAREVLELFTIGRGNYTESDIKNAARAFTGWGFNRQGEFVFKRGAHDFDEKTFIGHTGNFDGEDILDIVLEDRRSAEFLAAKIYRYFVNDNINDDIVHELASDFYDSEYDIGLLMKSILISDWFYDEANVGAKIKSPVELITGSMKTFGIEFQNPLPIVAVQRSLGQVLFNPPNVGGWAGGKSWIDSSSLMYRMKLPEILFKSSELEFDYKEDPQEEGEEMMNLDNRNRKMYRKVKTSINLSDYYREFGDYSGMEMVERLSDFMIQTEVGGASMELVNKYADNSTKENMVESVIMKLMSLPEYQMY